MLMLMLGPRPLVFRIHHNAYFSVVHAHELQLLLAEVERVVDAINSTPPNGHPSWCA